MTDSAGVQIGATVKYLPFGEARADVDIPTDKLFTGQRLDATGLYYYNARYYDATIGRFISPDIIVPYINGSQSLNRYSYCRNNPIKYIDPSGYLDSDYYVLIQYLETSAETLQTLAAATANPMLLQAAYAISSQVPDNILSIVKNGTGGGIPFQHEYRLTTEGIVLACGVEVTIKILKDLIKRGWTTQAIENVFLTPYYSSPSKNLATGNPAKAFYRSDMPGDYMLVDLKTMKVVQIGRSFDPYWTPDKNIFSPLPSYWNPIYGRGHQLPPGYYGPDLYGNWPR
jgi:RHS repeat-associated protein